MAASAPQSSPLSWTAGDLLVVIPTLNEADRLPELIGLVFLNLPQAHLLVVDDDSPDGTAATCQSLQEHHEGLHLLVRRGSRGLGRALAEGMAWGIAGDYRWIATMDADLSHDPDALPELIAATTETDLVIGSRYVAGGRIERWRWHRRWLSRTANRFASLLLDLPVADVTSGFRVYRRDLLAAADPAAVRSTGYAFLPELLHRFVAAGGRVREIPICFVERRSGKSKLSLLEIPRGALGLLLARLRRPKGRKKS